MFSFPLPSHLWLDIEDFIGVERDTLVLLFFCTVVLILLVIGRIFFCRMFSPPIVYPSILSKHINLLDKT